MFAHISYLLFSFLLGSLHFFLDQNHYNHKWQAFTHISRHDHASQTFIIKTSFFSQGLACLIIYESVVD
jgi:hypothetical protein